MSAAKALADQGQRQANFACVPVAEKNQQSALPLLIPNEQTKTHSKPTSPPNWRNMRVHSKSALNLTKCGFRFIWDRAKLKLLEEVAYRDVSGTQQGLPCSAMEDGLPCVEFYRTGSASQSQAMVP